MGEGSVIYLMVHECNHLNRLMRFMLRPVEDSYSPRDDAKYNEGVVEFKKNDLGFRKGEGGRYLCNTLFGKNLIKLNFEQACFISNCDNWNMELADEDCKFIFLLLKS
jgi:hypothetical protein